MGKKGQNEVWIMWILKSLLAAYVVTGILLMILAMALYKFELTEEAVTAGITAVYLLSTFAGGLVAGKLAKIRRFFWGIVLGILYFAFLLLITWGIYISRKWNRDSDDICAVCGRWYGRRNDILRKRLRNLCRNVIIT